MQPVFLLADSQLLFRAQGDGSLPERLAAALAERAAEGAAEEEPAAAYLGASNGDEPAFFELFRAAMEQLGIRDCRHVPARPAADDLAFLERADLVLLAGGDSLRGMEAFRDAGIDALLPARYAGGALLVGVSAGAVQLGLRFASQGVDGAADRDADGLRVVPYLIDVHDDPEWDGLRRLVAGLDFPASGIGIPAGGAAVYYPDGTLEPLARPLVEITRSGDELREAMLMPGEGTPGGEPEPPS